MTTTMIEAAGPATDCAAAAPARVSWRFSPGGAVAACTVVRPGRPPELEIRTGTSRRRLTIQDLSVYSQLLPTDDGAVFIAHQIGGLSHILLVRADGAVSTTTHRSAGGLALVARPGGTGVVAVESTLAGASRLLEYRNSRFCELVSFDGIAVGAVWLDDVGRRMAVNITGPGQHCSAIDIDLTTGDITPMLSISPTSDDRISGYLPRANLIVLSTNATGEIRLGYGHPGVDRVAFPDSLSACGPVTYLAGSSDGAVLAVAVDQGTSSVVRIVDTGSGLGTDLPLPPLVVIGSGQIRGTRLTLPVSTSDRPGTLLHVDIRSGVHSFEDPAEPGAVRPAVRWLPGADGPVESLIYGDVEAAAVAVVALHGGPVQAWRATFDPLLAELVANGIAVVAPNIRGSSGYGRDHVMAIRNRWGGPDCDDVLAIGRWLIARRGGAAMRPIVLGTSYGAFLGMLAAQRAPGDWSGCVALSTFISGARVVDAGGAVAELVRRLGGVTSPDLRDRLDRISVPVLLVHGTADHVVPVSESGLLAAGLRAHGCPVHHLEISGGGHDLISDPQRRVCIDAILDFCREVKKFDFGRGPDEGEGTQAVQWPAPAATRPARTNNEK